MAADKNAEFDPSSTGALAVAALCVGLAIQLHDGEYSSGAIGLVTIALICTGWAIWHPSIAKLRPFPERWRAATSIAIVVAALALQFIALFKAWPGVDLLQNGGRQLLPFRAGLAMSIVWITLGLRGRLGRAWFVLLLATHLFLGIWMVRSSAQPHIDVWVFQQEAAAESLKGHNPYAMTFPDIYHSTLPGHQDVYGKGLVEGDRVQFGFPYPPVSLYMATIGYAIAGDHRYAQAVAVVLAGLLIGYCRPGLMPKLAAALLMFSPRVFFVLGRGWTEPFTILFMAATIYLACRRPRLTWIALGLLLATKQYMVLAVPISFFLLPGPWRWRDWFLLLCKSAVVAAAVTLPIAVWDFPAFWKSTVTVQTIAPFRWDAISYLVWYGFRGHLVTEPSTAAIWSTLAAAVTLGLCLWKSPRSPAGFAASLGLILLGFFSFNKQAFCNYYFFVIGALCCGIAVNVVDVHASSSRQVGRQ
ncbi:MAG TPA: hypothetical protein VIM11_25550 [Tepidisphaeraceae bacterium]|jgi:hypothetical protein